MELIRGKSFIGTLEMLTDRGQRPLISLDKVLVESGWLVPGPIDAQPVELRFDFLESVSDRDHYTITATSGPYAGAKLGVSRNGFAGFYSVAEVIDFWKLDWVTNSGLGLPQPEDSEGFDFEEHTEAQQETGPETGHFFLRDHRGHRVGLSIRKEITRFGNVDLASDYDGWCQYLTVEEEDIRLFKITVVKVVEEEVSV